MIRLLTECEQASARAALLLLNGEKYAPCDRITQDETLDIRVALDSARILGAEIRRLRRLVRKLGGRP